MITFNINYLAVVVSAVASMFIGSFWYGPLFGKPWSKLMGWTPEKMEAMMKEMKEKGGMWKMYVAQLIASLLMSYILAHFVIVWGAMDWMGALALAFWIWLGFIATVMLGTILWEGKSPKLYFLNVVYQFVNLFVMALILAYWK